MIPRKHDVGTGRGKLITLEGIDGAGKTTQLEWLAEWLRGRGKNVVVTREPGGTALGEKLRELLLSHPMAPETEILLMFAARNEHIAQVIEPALSAGRWVVCDRFTDASYAYQGGGRGLQTERIGTLECWVQGDLRPDLTLLFDVPVDVARKRLAATQSRPDRFEREQGKFFDRVRSTYLARARAEPARVRVLDGRQGLEIIKKELEDVLITICSKHDL